MNRFGDLRRPMWSGPTSDYEKLRRRIAFENEYAANQLPVLVSENGMHWWQPGDPICNRGFRLLIGVADWSLTDLGLLDLLDEYLQRSALKARVDVFNLGRCRGQDELRQYFPQIAQVIATPVVGVWDDGTYLKAAVGFPAVRLIEHHLGVKVVLARPAGPERPA
jgi:hypothetical protein